MCDLQSSFYLCFLVLQGHNPTRTGVEVSFLPRRGKPYKELKLLSRVPKLVSGKVRLKHHFSDNFFSLPKFLFTYSVEVILKCSDLLYSEASRNY